MDIFLLLSGFLFCRILLIELERRRGNINVIVLYVARYIRLTPAYLMILGFQMTWFKSIGDGPIWNSRIGLEEERCRTSWWLNILYINNYFGTENLVIYIFLIKQDLFKHIFVDFSVCFNHGIFLLIHNYFSWHQSSFSFCTNHVNMECNFCR